MKKRDLGIRIIIGLCAALGWWGLLYPELVLTPDTVKIVAEDGTEEPDSLEWSFDSRLYLDLLNAGRDKIIPRSKLLTDISSFWEAFHDKDSVK
mgnify:FL=1